MIKIYNLVHFSLIGRQNQNSCICTLLRFSSQNSRKHFRTRETYVASQ